MKVIKDTLDFHIKKKSVVTLGKFDSLHRGHRTLIEKVLAYQGKNVSHTVFTFMTSPVSLLSQNERRHMLKQMGIDLLIECPFVPELITMDPEEFVKRMLVKQLNAVHVVVGYNFRFGYKRKGNPDTLIELGEKYGFTVEVIPQVTYGDIDVCSSRIREELAKGNMELVNALLGYDFSVSGEIVHGQHVGSTIGIPTTNLIPPREKLLPPNGVYVTKTTVGNETYMGMTNIGTKPTVDGSFVGVETYLFDCEENLYGENERVRILHYVRPEQKFSGLDELKNQLKRDEEQIRGHIKHEWSSQSKKQ